MKHTCHALIATLESEFIAHADPSVAVGQAAYMRNQFVFLGLTKPQRALIQKTVFNEFPVTTSKDLYELVTVLWSFDAREFQYAAVDLADKHLRLFEPDGLTILEQMIRQKPWWDTVDLIAGKLVGGLVRHYPELVSAMDQWITDESFWIRRTAILHQLKYKHHTDEARLFRYCQQTIHESEFFIRKAIGWALREYAKTNPEAVLQFITEYRTQLSNLSYREAGKHILE